MPRFWSQQNPILQAVCGVYGLRDWQILISLSSVYVKVGRIQFNLKEQTMQKVVIFGAGNCGRLIGANLIKQGKAEILAFIDNDSQKAGQKVLFSGLDSNNVAGGGG